MKMSFKTLELRDGCIYVLDQTKLPLEEVYLEARTTEDIYNYIKELVVRGATLIGVTAGYGMWLGMQEILRGIPQDQYLSEEEVEVIGLAYDEKARYINSSRPTAVNLSYAVNRMLDAWDRSKYSLVSDKASEARQFLTPEDILGDLLKEADAIKDEDSKCSRLKGEYALELLSDGMTILTHCNAGALTGVDSGGIFDPFYVGKERGLNFKLYCDETRPLLQGARLSAWELSRMGIDTTLICDNMASTVMKQGKIDAVMVGCDRMAANGDFANKIGTSGVAILAKEYNIPFYVSLPTTSIDMLTEEGDDIVIEERDGTEVTEKWYKNRLAPMNVSTYNPAFDVTDNKYITAIITEKGIVYPLFSDNLKALMED